MKRCVLPLLVLCFLVAACCPEETSALRAQTDAGLDGANDSAGPRPVVDTQVAAPKVDAVRAGDLGAAEGDDSQCLGGEGEACLRLGLTARGGVDGQSGDHPRAHMLFKSACGDGVPAGCVELGLSHLDERSGYLSPRKARAAFKKGCDAKSARGCFELAGLFAEGEGGPRDQAQAVRLYYRACQAGHEAACAKAR